MADYFYGEITIPKVFLPFVEKNIAAQFGPEYSKKEYVDGPTITFSDGQACNGEFLELEAELESKGIPFDRHSEGFCELLPENKFYRPAGVYGGEVSVTITTSDGESHVSTEKLKKLLELDVKEVLPKLRELINEADPVKQELNFWSESPYAHLLYKGECVVDKPATSAPGIYRCAGCGLSFRSDAGSPECPHCKEPHSLVLLGGIVKIK